MTSRPRSNRPLIVNGWDFGPHQLLSPGDVAKIFRVTPKTVGQWAEQGKLTSVRTPGGARRFSRHQIEHYLHNEHPMTLPRTVTSPHEPSTPNVDCRPGSG